MIKYLEFKTNKSFSIVFKKIPEHFYQGLITKLSPSFFSKEKSEVPVIITVDFEEGLLKNKEFKKVGRKFIFNELGYFLIENNSLAKIEFDKLSNKTFYIKLESGFDPIRFIGNILEPITRIILLNNGFLSLHSSSCQINAKGFVFPAWGNVGKTNLVLAMKNNGATIFGDDWTTITPAGKALIDIRPINLLFYNFKIYPEFKQFVSRRKRFMLMIDSLIRNQFGKSKKRKAISLRIFELSLRLTETLSNVQIPLEKLQLNTNQEMKINFIYHMFKHKKDDIEFDQNAKIGDISKKSASCFIYENKTFIDHINEYAYASGYSFGAIVGQIEKLHIKTYIDIFGCNKEIKIGLIKLPENPSRSQLDMFAKKLKEIT